MKAPVKQTEDCKTIMNGKAARDRMMSGCMGTSIPVGPYVSLQKIETVGSKLGSLVA